MNSKQPVRGLKYEGLVELQLKRLRFLEGVREACKGKPGGIGVRKNWTPEDRQTHKEHKARIHAHRELYKIDDAMAQDALDEAVKRHEELKVLQDIPEDQQEGTSHADAA